jgi:ubiquinone/menaquinone biosynthesis C-methylase UbiE
VITRRFYQNLKKAFFLTISWTLIMICRKLFKGNRMELSFSFDPMSTKQAKTEAEKIAMGPFVFQATRVIRDFSILKLLIESGNEGLSLSQIQKKTGLSDYALGVLTDAGLSIGLFIQKEDHLIITKIGYFIETDEMARVNMDFSHDVNYQGLFYLDEALKTGKPSGLKVFGDFKTIYEGLSRLSEPVRKSWFGFDHYYSDDAFPRALPIIFKNHPRKILDIGGNTGKFSIACAAFNQDVRVTILDHEKQLDDAAVNIRKAGFQDRVNGIAIDLLDPGRPYPKGYDVIWMSQFLDCFGPDEIRHLVKRAYDALDEGGILYVMETFVDRQKFPIAKFCLDMTSLYFTALANGNSRMYHAAQMLPILKEAGFKIEKEYDEVSISHTLVQCRKSAR